MSDQIVSRSKLVDFIVQLFVSPGVYSYDAAVCADRLIDADLAGEFRHGLAALEYHLNTIEHGDIDPRAMTVTLSETPAVAFLDGNQGMGHVAGTKAVELAIQKAKKVGTGTVVVSNSQDFGSPAVYARLIADAGCVGYCTTSTGEQSTRRLAGSDAAILGRHEFAWGIPASETETLMLKGCSGHADTGETSPLGATVSIGHSVLTGLLAGGKLPMHKTRGTALERTEHFLYAINPEHFGGVEKFQKQLLEAGESLKSLDQLQRVSTGNDENVSISAEVAEQFTSLAEKFKVALPF